MFARLMASFAALVAAGTSGCATLEERGDPAMPALDKGPSWVTVIGDVATPNRPPFNGFDDAFIKAQQTDFERAVVFDPATLRALPQREVRAQVEGWPAPLVARGPLLADVLNSAGVDDDKTVTFFALDGYRAALTGEERAARDWILALSVDGAPLGVGGRGPTWLLHATPDGPADPSVEAQWVWSAYLIAVGDEPMF